MKKLIKTFIFTTTLLVSSLSIAAQTEKPITVGIVVPIALPAMTQIVHGYQTALRKQYNGPITFVVKNAQGDPNIQRSILQEFKSDNVDIVAPIGTSAAQMTIAMIHNKPIVGIAAEHLKAEAKQANNHDVTGDLDQVSVVKQIQFIHAALPNIKKITIVYSTASRIYSEVKKIERAAKPLHITVQKLMMTQLSDLYSISKNIASNSQAIFILKDELVVSGINTILQQAEHKNIPLIASDDGSVSKGAAFALGVSENQIGVDAAHVTAKILDGKKAGKLPVHIMRHYYVFLNPTAAEKQNINPSTIKKAAKKLGYPVTIL